MTFEREERIALARIISDLIETDFIIVEDEMEAFDKIRNEKDFNITMSMCSEAKKITFSEAVSTLQALTDEQKKTLIKDKLYEISLSDGTCVSLEALMIIAVKYALEGKGDVFSIPYSGSVINNMTVFYIENENDTGVDAYIHSHYRAISNEFRLAGFDFVYIPRIADDYRQIRGEYLHKVIKYMIPTLDDGKIEKIQDKLCSITTSKFSHELLYKKMGINVLSSKPAFLFKIGESFVADKNGIIDIERNMYSNFFLVRIDKMGESVNGQSSNTILKRVVELMDLYRSMIDGKIFVEPQPLSKKFLYYGFHRSLFNLVAYGKERGNYKLIINIKNPNRTIVLRPLDAVPENILDYSEDLLIDLHPQPCTLYILIIYMSLLDENLDWADYTHKSEMKKLILEKYNAIYKMISKGKRATEYRDNSHISRIKKSLKSFSDIVSNIDLFIPEKVFSDQRCCYNVPIPPNLVYVIEGPKGEEREVKMVDSEFWRSNLS